MNKEKFLNHFKEEEIATRLYNKYILALNKNITVFSKEFLSPGTWSILSNMKSSLGVCVHSEGVFEESDRRMIAFSAFEDKPIFPIEILKIEGKSKFHKLKHKDFLGSIMALGIEREKMGDLVVEDNICYLPIADDISDYIKFSLETVGRVPCSIRTIDSVEELPRKNLEEKIFVISSLRLDNVVSSICGISRSKATELISSGKVSINYSEAVKKDRLVQEDDTLIIRGSGKFIFKEVIGLTSKSKYRIVIQQYV